ncbi:hypothetical protein BDP27DRAFT_1448043 [Rhodocollybia butyracea]|uniref:Uncharacterized protein n=1 Tax=Rhodocollybia butyracea TaxID=206335 RepID=A0A9P5PV08_9AGAR|nr:hypothetical protein BDP27DRAFT_1448043 [Rhodocollybia butyracea]
MSQLTHKSELDKWDWVDAGLEDVHNLARKQGWDACADQLVRCPSWPEMLIVNRRWITDFLNEEGVGIQKMYRNPANYERIFKPGKERGKGLLSANSWDSHLGDFLSRMLGDAIRGDSSMLPDVVTMWWHGTIQSLLDAASKQRTRSDANGKIEQDVEKLFGRDWLKGKIPKDFNLGKMRSALRKLKNYNPMWQLISSTHVEIMEQPISFADADVHKQLEARWGSLTENARKMEFCPVAIAWMLGVVQAKKGVILMGLLTLEASGTKILDRRVEVSPFKLTALNSKGDYLPLAKANPADTTARNRLALLFVKMGKALTNANKTPLPTFSGDFDVRRSGSKDPLMLFFRVEGAADSHCPPGTPLPAMGEVNSASAVLETLKLKVVAAVGPDMSHWGEIQKKFIEEFKPVERTQK